MEIRERLKTAFIAAFPHTVPILAGFLFLGTAYGIFMRVSGFTAIFPMIMSLAIYAGSVEFLVVGVLRGPFDPLGTLMLTLTVNARHLFYGISMLSKYREVGPKKAYLIFGLSDETFSINCTADIVEGVDKGWFWFFVTLLNHMYWFIGATIGGTFGSFIRFDTTGLEFVMTALFVVIFVEQWIKEKSHYCSILGVGASLVFLILLGRDSFLIPTLISILATLTLLKKPLERKGVVQ